MAGNPPITDQDDWQIENLDYLAKDGDLARIVLPKLHEGDYVLIEEEDDEVDEPTKFVIVNVDIKLSLY